MGVLNKLGLSLVLGLFAATCTVTFAQESLVVDLQAVGLTVAFDGSGAAVVTVDYTAATENVYVEQAFDLEVRHVRGGATLHTYLQRIILGYSGDGTNCNSGGTWCDGKCRALIDGVENKGSCVHHSTDSDGGWVCVCKVGSNKPTNVVDELLPGDSIEALLDAGNEIAETDETNNSVTLVYGN